MAEVAQSQASDTTPTAFSVTLGEGDGPLRELEGDEPVEGSESGEQGASAEDQGSPLDDVKYDPTDPVQKAAYEELRKQMLPKWQKRVESLKGTSAEQPQAAKTEPEKVESAPPAAAADTDDPVSEVYKVDLSSFRPKLEFREGSDLADYAEELTELMAQSNRQAVEAALAGVYENDKRFRERMSTVDKEQQAMATIAPYFEDVREHPEFQEKFAEIQAFAQSTKPLAISNPERWIRLVEAEFGLSRGWRGAVEAEQQSNGQKNQRLANKPYSQVPRSSKAPSSTAASDGRMTLKDSLDRRMREKGLM